MNDQSPDAYDRMVDRYLDSQHYGEEMARHWLDVARYADTHGMHLDNERQTWAYRDWVIDAFNRNLPFDQFTVEQLAGDLLESPTRDQIVATGFNRCNVTTSEGGSINEELLYRYAVDRASTTMQAWLGLTGGCAVCHDHKFDPITQKDFYSFYAFFNSAADPGMDGNALLTQPTIKLDSDEDRQQLASLAIAIKDKQTQIDAELAKVTYVDPGEKPTSHSLTESIEIVWMEDSFPEDGRVHQNQTRFVSVDEGQPVFSGKRAVQRTDAGLSQDVWDSPKVPLKLPAEPKLIAHVFLDPKNPPKAIMLQYFKKGWEHRAVWGDYDAIQWGAAGTTERVNQGPLPELGKWITLEVPAEKIGLASGDEIKGFAVTQFAGTVTWDHVGVKGTTNPALDPSMSFLAWWRKISKQNVNDLPDALRNVAKEGPDKLIAAADAKYAELVKQQADATQAAVTAKGSDANLSKVPTNEPSPAPVQPVVRESLHYEGEAAKLRDYYLQEVCQTTRNGFASLIEEKKQLSTKRQKLEESIPGTFVYKDLPKPRDSFVMMRGAYDKPGEAVEPNVPAVLPPLPPRNSQARASRLDLARWLVSSDNPLVARVTVNRFWQQIYGVGLVKSSYDFGSQGEMPSHPELLDWLAVDFQTSGWDVKRLIRTLVTSQAFRQSSQVHSDLLKYDPGNRLYARGPRFRLDAEQIRDNALFVSGLAQLQMGGKGVRTYQPDKIWEPVAFGGSNTQNYKRDSGPALYRRSIYTFLKRTAPPPFMVNFDAPNREQFCTVRERSNTPLQALQLMNDVQHVEAARALAERMILHGGSTAETRFDFAYQTLLARSPDEFELKVLKQQLESNLARYRSNAELAKKLISAGESKADESIDPAELAAMTLVANTLLNLDETVTRN